MAANNYWGRVKKSHAVDVGATVLGTRWERDHAKDTKPVFAKASEAAFAGDGEETLGLDPRDRYAGRRPGHARHGLWRIPTTYRQPTQAPWMGLTGSILRESLHILLQGTPEDLDIEAAMGEIRELEGVTDVHHVDAWSLTSGRNIFSSHVCVSDFARDGARVQQTVHDLLKERFRRSRSRSAVSRVRKSRRPSTSPDPGAAGCNAADARPGARDRLTIHAQAGSVSSRPAFYCPLGAHLLIMSLGDFLVP